jgi:hypothetical protein
MFGCQATSVRDSVHNLAPKHAHGFGFGQTPTALITLLYAQKQIFASVLNKKIEKILKRQ